MRDFNQLPEDPNKEPFETAVGQDVSADLSSQSSAPAVEAVKKEPEAQWYGVSYQSGERSGGVTFTAYSQPSQPNKKKRGRVIAVVAVLVLCALVSSVAGFGGALLAGFLDQTLEEIGSGDPFQNKDTSVTPEGGAPNSTQSGVAGGGNTTAYPFTDTDYDYAAVIGELQKNNDSSLIGSANGSAGDAKKSLIEVTAAIKDSVVEITTTTVSNRGTISAGAGSGVIIHEDGIIVTNNHVIEDCDNIYVRLTNGETYVAALRGTDEAGDIAILKITPQSGSALTVAKLGYSAALALGEEVIAIGNPLGELGGTVTNGIISATEREISVDGSTMKLLQTNAAINSGNSGGGLFNMAGELIGVVNAKYSASGVEGLGFAIPIDSAFEDSFKDLLNYGYIRGIPALPITLVDAHVGYYQMYAVYGAYVYKTNGNTDFAEGDYIYSIDGKQVYGMPTSPVSEIQSIIRAKSVGDSVEIKIKRGNSYVTKTITLIEYVPGHVSLDVQD